MHIRAIIIFIVVFSSRPPKKRKEFQRNTLDFFGVFGFLEQAIKREKQKQEKLFTRESSQQEKEEQKIFLGFILILLLSMHRK